MGVGEMGGKNAIEWGMGAAEAPNVSVGLSHEVPRIGHAR